MTPGQQVAPTTLVSYGAQASQPLRSCRLQQLLNHSSVTHYGLLPSPDSQLSSPRPLAQPRTTGLAWRALDNTGKLGSFLSADELLRNVSEVRPPTGKHSQMLHEKLLSLE